MNLLTTTLLALASTHAAWAAADICCVMAAGRCDGPLTPSAPVPIAALPAPLVCCCAAGDSQLCASLCP
ncbi:hypothetical protein PsYK624_143830 [Phanerochaete sordida]|uniref:Hydrophobin n=1 Tax=Phanerochaete sordida TaxID=48140 RepID=A0A9P3GNW9_9APHY|nr:hypothetical protein PsYK624_143830 [Phanerochaete sordida]